jgi:hypothetical protein
VLISRFTVCCDECPATHEASRSDMTGEAVRAEAAASGWVMVYIYKFKNKTQTDLCRKCSAKRKGQR